MRQDWKDLSRRLTFHLKLATHPLGFKFIRRSGDMAQIEGLGRSEFKRPLCQFIGSARYLGKAWAVTPEDQLCQWGGWCAGVFPDIPESIISGCLYSDRFLNIADGDTARQISAALPKNEEHFEACAIMPLDGGTAADGITFEPDQVIIYGEPAQIADLIMPACAALGLPAIEARILGDTAICADGIAASWNSGQPRFFLPCIGDRALGGALPSEVAVVFPAVMLTEAVVSNVERLNFSPNWNLEAPVGASPEIRKLMQAMAASTFPLDRGTPIIPEATKEKEQ
jgi:uncharacterized protein (DUF169 family)